MPVQGISEQGRATQGVKLIRVDEGDEIAALTRLDESEVNGVNGESNSQTGTENGGAQPLPGDQPVTE
jgi:DNA gyrase subunit A